MKHNSKKWLKGLGLVFGALVLIVIGYVIYVFASYYRLEDMQRLTIAGKSSEKAKPETTYRITSGNIDSEHTVMIIPFLWTEEKKAVRVLNKL